MSLFACQFCGHDLDPLPCRAQIHATLDSFVHKDDKIGIGNMDQQVIDTFNNKAEVVALEAEVAARVQADESLRDDLDETRGVYGANSHGPVVRDKDGNEVFERTDDGMVQIDYPEGGHDQPAMQIDGNTIQQIWEHGGVWVHVSHSPRNRRQVLSISK